MHSCNASRRARGYGGASSAPPLPSGLPHPLPDQGCGPGPGAASEGEFAHRDEDAKRPRRRYRSRLRVRGVSVLWYFFRNDIWSEAPGLRRRCARPRPSGRMDRWDSLLAQPRHCVPQGCALWRRGRRGEGIANGIKMGDALGVLANSIGTSPFLRAETYLASASVSMTFCPS